MSDLFIDDLFNAPKVETGDRVRRREAGLLGRKRGSSRQRWRVVCRHKLGWKTRTRRREYIPDLEIEGS